MKCKLKKTNSNLMGINVLKKVMTTILKFILFFLGWAVVSGVLPLLNTDNQAIWRLWAEATPLIAMITFTVIFWLIEKKSIKLNLFCNSAKGLIVGSIAGTLWLSIAVVVMLLIGVIHFESTNSVSGLVVWIIAAFLNVIMQEMLVRGYLYQMIKQKHNIVGAIIVTSGLFVVLHGGAFEAGLIPVLNVLSMSLLMTVVLEYTGGLIAPIIMHAIWNIVGSIILGGVSLADDYPHLINTSFTGNTILSGGDCKIEGSVVVLILNTALIFFFLLRTKRSKA